MALPMQSGSMFESLPDGGLLGRLPLIDPIALFARLRRLPHCVFFDSAIRDGDLGRYSYLAADPIRWWDTLPLTGGILEVLRAECSTVRGPKYPGIPPFQGGLAGLFSYELRHEFERLPQARFNELDMPRVAVGLYDVVFAFDHLIGDMFVISRGWPESEQNRRAQRARERVQFFFDAVARAEDEEDEGLGMVGELGGGSKLLCAPRFGCGLEPQIQSTFSPEDYLSAVQRTIDYIVAGDVFQVNLAQELLTPQRCDSSSMYLRLRQLAGGPMSGYFDLGKYQLLSASPELLLRLEDGITETRPIKGTRPRTGDPAVDAQAVSDLIASEKDRAENIMIVDLLRNDLSRVCQPESVRVERLCHVRTYSHVFHLVSEVSGRLGGGRDAFDVLKAIFPGGSVTGAPKIRAMEIIAELEPTARGPYCGSLGYISADGDAQFNILIRTIVADGRFWRFSVGGGVTAQSDPAAEFRETLDKAAGIIAAMHAERADLLEKKRLAFGTDGLGNEQRWLKHDDGVIADRLPI